MSKWTFLTNHSHVLVALLSHPDMRAKDIALGVGITERAVLKILKELEEASVIKVTKNGRRNSYELDLDQSLRHPLESHKTVGDLFNFLATKP